MEVSWGEHVQINRLFEIVYLLMDRKGFTASELAAHFEVSKRTILRDIDSLSAAGIPVYTMQGKGGGIFIHDSFVLNKTVLSEEEQNQIIFALQSMSATRHLETENTLGRLRSLFEKQGKDWIEVDFSRWGNSAADKAKFETLKNAVTGEKALAFTYFNSSGERSDRKVYPQKLAFKSKSWYLQAFCLLKNDYRLFKINRMRDVEILPERFDGQAFQAPEIEPVEDQAYGNHQPVGQTPEGQAYGSRPPEGQAAEDQMPEGQAAEGQPSEGQAAGSRPPEGKTAESQSPEGKAAESRLPKGHPSGYIDVKLRFAPEAAYRVYDEFDDRSIEKNEDGSFTVYMTLPHDYWLYDYVLSFGAYAEVLEPQGVRDKVIRHLERIIDNYSTKT